ncbi:nitronate monooxygenase family protein [Bacteriovorax sp. DB6_IX]|uniref:NAD(P)H-dependent flavin oxidoreductase n=1 Tax=Bacteriovorax sp. DB6_IX TaxID=1353530 RepID=UPI000389E0DB|nr:nitronate monooxygenase [Bacteriovorax sp. DB6_IX]EQC50772.1 thiazole biosynthesis protein ThiG-like protein [Bacteriovorax sp. DB6_IX]
MIKTWLTDTFNIKYPIIMAPMFLVSSNEMLIKAAEAGIMGCIPALNWRTPEEFEEGIKELKEKCQGPFGINLIVNKSNIHLKKQIDICAKYVPVFYHYFSWKSGEVIKKCQPNGTKVICDVVDVTYAQKVESLGADAIIAVNSGAGGHAGPTPASILIPLLKKNCNLPVITAGGIGTGTGLLSALSLGAEGASIGSPFIATEESPVSQEYKDAVVQYGAKDIVLSTKVSGTPCTVINTPYVQKIGTEQNMVESLLTKNKKLKKYVKMLTYYKGMKLVENAAFAATYKTVWCAGPSIEFINKIEPVKTIVDRLISEYEVALEEFKNKLS